MGRGSRSPFQWKEFRPSEKDSLLDRLARGKIAPREAEQEARRLGIGPLEQRPNAAAHDPIKKLYWSPYMALAWIMWRDADAVREWDDEYRAECWEFQACEWRPPGKDGISARTLKPKTRQLYRGHTVKQRQPMTDVRAQLEYALRARNQTPVMSIRAARSALRNAIDHEDKPRVLFERAEILRQWPTRAVSSVGRKPKFDWDAIRAEACRLMDHHGEFHSTDPEWRAQASLEVALKGFCAEKWDKEPADSTLRERLRPWLAAWRADKRAVGN